MGGFFGVAKKDKCVNELFYGVDYNSHMGTKRAGIATCNNGVFTRSIHNIENAYFRSKFFTDNEKGLYDFTKEDFWRDETLLPAIDGAKRLPDAPSNLRISQHGPTIRLAWSNVKSDFAERPTVYNVYVCPTDTFSASAAKRIATRLTCPSFDYTPALPTALHQKGRG